MATIEWYTMSDHLDELQQTWHAEIPISKAMAIEVSDYQNGQLIISADLIPNINVHGTAFAGSLYAISALCGWGSTWLQMKQIQTDTSIVIAEGHISYLRPVKARIFARCHFDPDAHRQTLQQLVEGGKGRFELGVEIFHQHEVLANFSGSYAVRIDRH